MKQLRAHLKEYQQHLEALESGQTFTPKLTARSGKRSANGDSDSEDEGSRSESGRDRKRRSTGHDKRGPAKRRRSEMADDDDFTNDEVDEDDEDLIFSDSGSEADRGSDTNSDTDSSSDESSEADDGGNHDGSEQVTQESLRANIQEVQENIKQGRTDLSEYRRLRKEAVDALTSLKKKQSKVQLEKNAFCSLRRSEVRLYRWQREIAMLIQGP